MNSVVFVPAMTKDFKFATGEPLPAAAYQFYSLDLAKNAAKAERAGVHFLIHELVIDPGGVVLEDRGVVAEVVAGQLDASHAKEQNT